MVTNEKYSDLTLSSGDELHYYRQPGGCVETTMYDGNEYQLFHFCTTEDAEAFLKEFGAFIESTKNVGI